MTLFIKKGSKSSTYCSSLIMLCRGVGRGGGGGGAQGAGAPHNFGHNLELVATINLMQATHSYIHDE